MSGHGGYPERESEPIGDAAGVNIYYGRFQSRRDAEVNGRLDGVPVDDESVEQLEEGLVETEVPNRNCVKKGNDD